MNKFGRTSLPIAIAGILFSAAGNAQAKTSQWEGWTLLCTPMEAVVENYVEARRTFEKNGNRYGLYYRSARLTETRYAEVFNLYSMNPEDEGRFVIVGERDNRGPAAAFEMETVGQDTTRDFLVASVDIDTYVA
ncbi:MAG: hypothetical protein AAF603_08840, partial [Pseudomonadota bacterium]